MVYYVVFLLLQLFFPFTLTILSWRSFVMNLIVLNLDVVAVFVVLIVPS